MSSASYELYRDSVFTIAKTLVVKHSEAAAIMNTFLVAKGYYVDQNNPSSWKYYLNLAGQYHESDLDEINAINKGVSDYIQIKVASNAGPVSADFTRALIDPITGDIGLANEYVYNSFYYKQLLETYPDHETLILGILNPIPLNISTVANDGDILYIAGYFRTFVTDGLGTRTVFLKRNEVGLDDPGLIEDQEYSLISRLETWIKACLTRWHNQDYTLLDDVYFAAMLGVLYLNIPKQILNIRLQNCNTNEVHSFHITSYLESHGKLGKYVPSLPLKQQLFLYRNVRWIEKNAGKQETFDLMVERLANENNVPLSGYKLVHNLSKMPDDLYPSAKLQRDVINFVHIGSIYAQTSVLNMLNRMKYGAKENHRDIESIANIIDTRAELSLDNDIPTKIIESDMVDGTDQVAYPLEKVLVNEWFYRASTGEYTGNIFVTNPVTADRLLLTPVDAMVLALYCLNYGYTDSKPLNIPTLIARNILRNTAPLISDIEQNVEVAKLSSTLLMDMDTTVSPTWPALSSDSFYRQCSTVQQGLMNRYYRATKEEDYEARGYADYILSRYYHVEIECPLALSGTLYSDWLTAGGYSLGDLSRDDLIQLGLDIVREATGIKVDTSKQLSSLQEAVIEIMKQFSSYNVHYVYQITAPGSLLLMTKTLRGGNIRASARATLDVPFNTLEVTDIYFLPINPVHDITTVPEVLI